MPTKINCIVRYFRILKLTLVRAKNIYSKLVFEKSNAWYFLSHFLLIWFKCDTNRHTDLLYRLFSELYKKNHLLIFLKSKLVKQETFYVQRIHEDWKQVFTGFVYIKVSVFIKQLKMSMSNRLPCCSQWELCVKESDQYTILKFNITFFSAVKLSLI